MVPLLARPARGFLSCQPRESRSPRQLVPVVEARNSLFGVLHWLGGMANDAAERCGSTQAALVMLCGLPAAGKTTLSCLLLERGPEQLRRQLDVPGVRIWHLCFDAVLARLETEQHGVVGFDPELWHRAREIILTATRAHCMRIADAPGASASSQPSLTLADIASCALDGEDGERCVDVLVLDDNMHYRSMRKAYYRIAREAKLGLCTLCLPIDADAAADRDAARPEAERVGRSTIELMAEALQWPEPEKHPWECSVLTLDPPPAVLDETRLWTELGAAISRPVQATAITGVEAEARAATSAQSTAQNAENATHQLDLRLRRTIGEHLRAGTTRSLPSSQRSALARVLSERKKETLLACRKLTQGTGAAADEAVDFDVHVDALEQQFAMLLTKHLRSC